MKVVCKKCLGNKTYRGMGSMTVKCEPCHGSGSIEIETKLNSDEPIKKLSKVKKNGKEKG